MLFKYKAITPEGKEKKGEIDAATRDLAVSALQRRNLVVVMVVEAAQKSLLKKSIPFFDRVAMKDVVIMSRQIATLFEAQVSAVKVFNLLAENTENTILRNVLYNVAQDIKGGMTISTAMHRHPDTFSDFYVAMVAAGEESGKLTNTFTYLADHLERQHELNSKTRNALVYPVFVILTFIAVIILMMTLVIPQLSEILIEVGGEIPVYTKAVIWVSDIFVDYGLFFLLFIVVVGVILWRTSRSGKGEERLDALKISLPYFGDLYRKVYLSRISDNINTMLSAGIPVVRTMEITGAVVDNRIFENIIREATENIKAGMSVSDAFGKHRDIPEIMVAMIKVGEETGSLGSILKTLSRFYQREVKTAVDTLIGLIEPALIIVLGVMVAFLLVSILLPIYNIAGSL